MENTKLENLTKSELDKLLNKDEIVLLEFYGVRCMPCKMAAEILAKIKKERQDFKLYCLDVDKNMQLAKEFSVLTVPTYVLFKNGKQAEKVVGFRQYNQINDLLNKHKNNS